MITPPRRFACFEWLVNGLTLFAAVLVVFYIGDQYSGRRLEQWLSSRPSRPSDLKGRAIPSGLHATAGRKMVLIALSTSCGYCQKEIPTYRELISLVQNRPVDLVAVFPQEDMRARAYLAEKGLTELRLHSGGFGNLAIHGTPTVLLISAKGIISEVIEGSGRRSAGELIRALDSIN